MFSIRNLTKSYATKAGRHYVFKNISCDFPEDVNIGILGPNGAGKSTFLRILGGIDFPDTGYIKTNKSLSWPLGLKGGFVGHLTGRENCRMVFNLYEVPHREIKKKLGFVRQLSGIGHYFDEPVKYYSSGMGARLGFALSMAFDFDYFLIDEITAVGDSNFRKIAKDALNEKRKHSKVIMVSHQMNTIKDFCDVAVLLKGGGMQVYLSVDEAIKAYFPQTELQLNDLRSVVSVENMAAILDTETIEQKIDPYKKDVVSRMEAVELALANHYEPREPTKFYYQIGEIYQQFYKREKALEFYALAHSSDESDLLSAFRLAVIYCAEKQYIDAERVCRKSLGFDVNHPGLNHVLHVSLKEQDRGNEAEEYIEKAVKARPNNYSWWCNLAEVYRQNGKLDQALDSVIASIKKQPTEKAFELMSQIFFDMGLKDQALLAKAKAIQLKERNPRPFFRSLSQRLRKIQKMIDM